MAWVMTSTGYGSNNAYITSLAPSYPTTTSYLNTTPSSSVLTEEVTREPGSVAVYLDTILQNASGQYLFSPAPSYNNYTTGNYLRLRDRIPSPAQNTTGILTVAMSPTTPIEPGVPAEFLRAGLFSQSGGTSYKAGGLALYGGLSVNRAVSYPAPFNLSTYAVSFSRYTSPSTSNALSRFQAGSPGTTAYFSNFVYSVATSVGHIRSPGSTTTYATSSDHRLKKDITPLDLTEQLDKINKLKPREWKWKSSDDPSLGFIAHEVQEVFDNNPDIVSGKKDEVKFYGAVTYVETGEYVDTYENYNEEAEETEILPVIIEEPSQEEKDRLLAEGKEWKHLPLYDNPVYQSIDTSFLVSPLVASVQALTARVQSLESRVAELESA